MKTQLYYTVEVRDKNGKRLSRLTRKSRSFVRQYNDILFVQISYIAAGGEITAKDTGGTDRDLESAVGNLRVDAAAGSVLMGIVIGTGATAVAIDDYALGALIAEGTGSGQMSYLAVTFTEPSVSAPDCSFTVSRIINNSSGATITVTETGIYAVASDGAGKYFLIVRDVLTSSQVVPDGGALTVTYTMKVTV